MISAAILLILLAEVQGVLYSITPDYKVALQQSPTELVHCYYQEKLRESGWNRLYIHANAAVEQLQQYRGAGMCEGYATYKEIYYAYTNFYKSLVLKGSPNVNAQVKSFQDSQLLWLDAMAAKNTRDPYWQHVNGTFQDYI